MGNKIAELIIIIVMIGAIYFIFFKNSNSTSNSSTNEEKSSMEVQSLSASLVKDTIVTDRYNIKVQYKNPSSFGGEGATYQGTLFYLLDCPSDGTCPTEVPHPSVSDLMAQIYMGKDLLIPMTIAYDTSAGDPAVPNTNVIMYINGGGNNKVPPALLSDSFKPTPGKKYLLGISITNNEQSTDGNTKIPTVYGNFVYTTINLN